MAEIHQEAAEKKIPDVDQLHKYNHMKLIRFIMSEYILLQIVIKHAQQCLHQFISSLK
jgi:hypothetical protein